MSFAAAAPWNDVIAQGDFRRWTMSSLVVVGVHCATLATAMLWSGEAAPPPPPAMMIDLALPEPAPAAAPTVAPPPQPQHAAVSPPQPRPEPPVVRKPLPKQKMVPAPVAPTPVKDAALVPEPPLREQAGPPAENAETSRPQAPALGTPNRSADALVSWQGLLLAHLERHKRYPRAARARHQEGVAVLRFVVDRAGMVRSAQIERGSGFPLLDEEGLALLERAQPLPPVPPQIEGEQVSLVVPVQFSLR